MKKLLLFSGLMFSSFTFAQSNVVGSGGDGSSATGTFSYSLGQIDYTYLTGTGGSASSGVQQSYELLTSDLIELASVSFVTYPNPAYDFMVVSISDSDPSNYSIEIKDSNGKHVALHNFNSKEIKIPLSHLSTGIYFLELHKADQIIGQEKIIKH